MSETMHRRRFLKIGGALAAAALGPAAVFCDDPPAKKRTIHKAIMYGTLTYKGPVLDQFRAVKAAGFKGVDERQRPTNRGCKRNCSRAPYSTGAAAPPNSGGRQAGWQRRPSACGGQAARTVRVATKPLLRPTGDHGTGGRFR